MTIPPLDQWGPFAAGIDPAERVARLRTLAAIVHLCAGPRGRGAVFELRAAETSPERLAPALRALSALEPLDRRRALATYAAFTAPPRAGRTTGETA